MIALTHCYIFLNFLFAISCHCEFHIGREEILDARLIQTCRQRFISRGWPQHLLKKGTGSTVGRHGYGLCTYIIECARIGSPIAYE